MNTNKYYPFLEKISYIEGIIRACEASGDIFPLQALLSSPEMKELLYKHFHFSSSEEFFKTFTSGNIHFYKKLEENFAGYKILFHARKQRSEHTVPNTHMCFCIRGQCFMYVNGQDIQLTPGRSCIIAPEVPTNYCNLSEDTIVIHVILTDAFISEALLPQLPVEYALNEFFRDIVFKSEHKKPFVSIATDDKYLEDMAYFLSSAFYFNTFKPPLWEEIVNNYILLFFCYQLSCSSRPATLGTDFNLTGNILTQIQDYIKHNCRNISLRQLAEVFHFNESYMSQYLKKNTGENFTRLLQKYRIELAEKLLSNTTLSVVEVSDRVGYQNIGYFYKIFDKFNQCSPTEYRSKFLNSNKRVIGQEYKQATIPD